LVDPKSFALFSAYALFLAFCGAIAVEAVKELGGGRLHLPGWWATGCAVVLIALVVAFDRPVRRFLGRLRGPAHPQHVFDFSFRRRPRLARGLVALVSSKAGYRSAEEAVRYHSEVLERLWLVHSSDSEENARMIARGVKEGVKVEFTLLRNLESIEEAAQTVQQIRRRALRSGLSDQELICDFTGMTKPASAGAVLAFVSPEARLQYMEPTAFLEDGRPDPNAPSVPFEVVLAYELESVEAS
jgi:hypothetical protein